MAEVPGLAFRMYFEISSIAGEVSSATVVELVKRFDATPHAVEVLEEGDSLRENLKLPDHLLECARERLAAALRRS